MKLLFCPDCRDLFKLDYRVRRCKCSSVAGYSLEGGDRVGHNGNGVMLGIGNQDLADMLAGGDNAEVWLYPTDDGKITVNEGL